MAITSADIKFKYSVKTGTAGNQETSTAFNSLGKYISTTEIPDAALNNLFDNVTGDQNAAGDVNYRCFFIHNAHATLTLMSAFIWISAEVPGGADMAFLVDSTVASPIGQASAQAKEVVNEYGAPSEPTFYTTTTKGVNISGSLLPGYCRAFWVRRTATNSAALDNDSVTLKVEGETAA